MGLLTASLISEDYCKMTLFSRKYDFNCFLFDLTSQLHRLIVLRVTSSLPHAKR